MWTHESSVTGLIMWMTFAALAVGCERAASLEDVPVGSRVTIETADGRQIEGTLVDVTSDDVVVESGDTNERREISRDAVSEVRREVGLGDLLSTAPAVREITIPADTVISLALETSLTSAANRPDDPVRAHSREPVLVAESVALPAGSAFRGTVTGARESGKVKGRAQLSFRFDEVRAYSEVYEIATTPLVFEAQATKAEDAKKIGIGAAAGAIIGGLTGGKKGAAVGSVVGGGAGTAVVVATPGEDIELASGTSLNVRLREPVTVRVPGGDHR